MVAKKKTKKAPKSGGGTPLAGAKKKNGKKGDSQKPLSGKAKKPLSA
jgi:hypothetical protein